MVVIVTRPEPDGTAFAAMLKESHIQSVLSPVMEIVFQERAPNLDGVTGFAFTSANGVRALANHLTHSPVGEILSLPVFAIGPATQCAAAKAGFSTIFVAGGTGESLASLIQKHIRSHKTEKCLIYHAAGSVRQGDLVTALAASSIRVRREVLYDAKALTHVSEQASGLLRSATENISVAFFSPRSARLFLEQVERDQLLDNLGQVTALCLSVPVAKLTESIRWKSVKVAKKPVAGALRDLLTP